MPRAAHGAPTREQRVTRIVGIDPGSRVTGYGVVDFAAGRAAHVASGCVCLTAEGLAERLRDIHQAVSGVVARYWPAQPDESYEMAVEQVFMHRNAGAALKLGQARGVALLAGIEAGLPVHEYSATQIKQSIVGRGHADKTQVQHMIRVLLSLPEPVQADAADALAAAICHAHMRATLARMNEGGAGVRGGVTRRGRVTGRGARAAMSALAERAARNRST